jgi:peptide deformylase
VKRRVMLMGADVLTEVARPVEDPCAPEIRALAADMWDTMAEEGGIGIAAPQLGVSLRMICFGREDAPGVPRTVLINPEIEVIGTATQNGWEGCLSLPGMRGRVDRAEQIRYRGFDLQGNVIERRVSGMHARVVQHEFDHLEGILYPMRITDWRNFGFIDALFPKAPNGED